MRLGSANTYDNALQNIYTRQSDLSGLQEKLSSGKSVNRSSDNPISAAQAERALTRMTRTSTEQRALDAQTSAITLAESALGDAGNLLQSLREIVVSAGSGSLNTLDLASKAQQMQGLRDQLLTLANRTDSAGTPLFGGLGSASIPFTETAAGVQFNGVAGQRNGSDVAVPSAMDGQSIWMNVRSGNGTFDVALGANHGTLSTDTGQVVSPSLVTGDSYSVNFTVAAGVTSYNVVDTSTGAVTVPVPPAAAPLYVDGQAIQFDGVSFVARGTPANGDAIQLSPSTQTNVFKVLDDAIAGIKNAASSVGLGQTVSLALTQLDTSMNRIQSARGQAGDWLNRADNIASAQQDKTLQLTADKSKAEDMDMVKGLSDFKQLDTGYQVALQSYAQIQKLSLFNYLS
jgi:flagellar hook-associated protein 3 FlgL